MFEYDIFKHGLQVSATTGNIKKMPKFIERQNRFLA